MRSVTTDTMNVWFLPSDRRAVIGAVRVCVCVCVCACLPEWTTVHTGSQAAGEDENKKHKIVRRTLKL